MGFHTYDVDRADALEDPTRYAYLSVDELLALFDPGPNETVADFGSGTGFYTDHVAPHVDTLLAVDIQPEMHLRYRRKGVPDGVELITAPIADLPLPDAHLGGAFSTMTYHEFASERAFAEIARVLAPGARFGVGDWTAAGEGHAGPPLAERYTVEEAVDALVETGFSIAHADERRETFVISARR